MVTVKRPGIIFILSSPSGGGKTTLSKRLLREVSGLTLSISHTSRPPRPGEREGVDYHFVTKRGFLEMRGRGEFAEWVRLHSHLYGTSRIQLEKLLSRGRDILMDIDTRGAAGIQKRYPAAVSIFILPPSFEDLEKRLRRRRSEGEDDIRSRLRSAAREIRSASRYRYLIVNRTLTRASRELAAIITAERLRLPSRDLKSIITSFLPPAK